MRYLVKQDNADLYYQESMDGFGAKEGALILVNKDTAQRLVDDFMALNLNPVGCGVVPAEDVDSGFEQDMSHLVGKYVIGYLHTGLNKYIYKMVPDGVYSWDTNWLKAEFYNNLADTHGKLLDNEILFEIVYIDGDFRPEKLDRQPQLRKKPQETDNDLSHLVGRYVVGFEMIGNIHCYFREHKLPTTNFAEAITYDTMPVHTGHNIYEITLVDNEVKPVVVRGWPTTTQRYKNSFASLYSKEPPIPLNTMETMQPPVFDEKAGFIGSVGRVSTTEGLMYNKPKPKLIVEVGEGENIVKFYDDGSYELLGAWVVKGNKAVPVQNVTGEIGGSDE